MTPTNPSAAPSVALVSLQSSTKGGSVCWGSRLKSGEFLV